MKNQVSIVDMAYEIIDMHKTIEYLEQEVIHLKQYEKKYLALLDDSMRHSHKTMENLLKLTLTPGVAEAMVADKEKS